MWQGSLPSLNSTSEKNLWWKNILSLQPALLFVLFYTHSLKWRSIQSSSISIIHYHWHYLTKWREPMCRVPERRLRRSQPAGLAPCLWCRSRWWSWGSRGSSASPATAGSWPPWWKAPSDERRWQRRWFSPCRPIWAAPSWPEEEEEERAEHR